MNSKNIASQLEFGGYKVNELSFISKGVKRKRPDNLVFSYVLGEKAYKEGFWYSPITISFDISIYEKNTVYRMESKITGQFRMKCDEDYRDNFIDLVKLSGIATLIAICRAHITTVSSLAGVNPPITLPLINVYDLIKSVDEQDSENNDR